MSILKKFLVMSLLVSSLGYAQDEEDDENEAAAPEQAEAQSSQADEMARILNTWQKKTGRNRFGLPRRWLFLQQSPGTYGAPSPLTVDKIAFENYGWFQLAEAEAIRLYIQMNPAEKKDELKPEELPVKLKRYAELANAEGVILKTTDENGSWALYRHTKKMDASVVNFLKGPDSFRGDVPVQWLVSQLNYDAMVVGTEGEYLVLAKLKPLKRGAQGVILKNSATALVTDAEKDVGALLRIVHDSEDYILAKVSLSKVGRPKVPIGSKVLFDAP